MVKRFGFIDSAVITLLRGLKLYRIVFKVKMIKMLNFAVGGMSELGRVWIKPVWGLLCTVQKTQKLKEQKIIKTFKDLSY